jgi:chemotaxis protein histidine kinase CheA/ActR/RegA family two-component response regulator
MDDLLQLLLSEFDLDVEQARAAMRSAQESPATASASLEFVGDFLSRSGQACELAGLAGLGQYLACVNEVRNAAAETGDPSLLAWLPEWVDAARGYLAAPTDLEAMLAIVAHMESCPHEVVQGLVPEISELLATASQLSDDMQTAAEPDTATAADVSIASDEADPGLLSAMLADAPDQLEQLRAFVGGIASGTLGPREVTEAQRIAHTLKGSGNIVGIVGIGRVSHYLENLLEWSVARTQSGDETPVPCTRDMTVAIDTLQDMVSALYGDAPPPSQAIQVLQRLMDWSWHIACGNGLEFAPDALMFVAEDAVDASSETAASDNDGNTAVAQSGAANSAVSQTVRVDSERLSRILRRAGQSLYAAQRMTQLIETAHSQLSQATLKHRELEIRLRELQTYVDSQVGNLRAAKDSGSDFDPLEMDRYDAMYSLSRFIAEDIQDQSAHTTEAMNQLDRSRDIVRDEQAQLTLQHRDLVDARMVAVKSLVPRLRRNVLQTAATLNKNVDLTVTGESTTADADVLTRLTEPLLHLVRNAVDHGIESAETRVIQGKSANGNVNLAFRQLGQEIEVTVSDDGRGLDAYAIHQKAIEFGLVDDATALSQQEIYRLILLPGFSTKSDVTEVSGRGVGMDVVNDRVVGMKGRLQIATTPNKGSTFTITVPVSTSSAKILLVEVNGMRVGLPIEQVVVAVSPDQILVQDEKLVLEGSQYPVAHLGRWLGIGENPASTQALQSAVIVRTGEVKTAVLVDRVIDVRESVLQDAGPLLRRVGGIVAATLREDGEPMFVVDVNALAQAEQRAPYNRALGSLQARTRIERTRIMVVDDALSVRRAMRQLLEDAGYDVVTCADGQEALNQLEKVAPALVLTDLEMPVVDGVELTRRVRLQPTRETLPIIMITSRASDKHRDLAYDAGVSVFLTKPYSDVELLAHVKERTAAQPKRSASEIVTA